MNCVEARRMVTRFIQKELTEKETEQFLKHLENCKDCQDELDIYFTVYKALDTLDSGTHHKEYDFRKMLEEEMKGAKHWLLRKRSSRIFRRFLVLVSEILLLMSVIRGYEEKKGIERHTIYNYAIHRVYGDHTDLLDRLNHKSEKEMLKEQFSDNETDKEYETETE